MKAFCRKAPCRSAPRRALDFSCVNFGWLHGFGRSPSKYISPDTLEYILSRGAAWNCPFSMAINLKQVETNPRTEDCFDTMRIWEDARIERKLTGAQQEALKNLDQEHHLFINERGEYELVAVTELASVADRGCFRAYSFIRASRPGDTYVLIWTTGDEASIVLDVPEDRLTAMRPFGKALPLSRVDDKVSVPISDRRYLAFADMPRDRVAELLREAKSSVPESTALYVSAKQYVGKAGSLDLTSKLGSRPAGALGDCLVPTAGQAYARPKEWYAEYTFNVPHRGRWHLWGRMWYKNTNSNSYFCALASRPEAKTRFGNSYVWEKWLWESGPTFRLEAGPAAIRVYVRESAPKVSPLLDVLCLTNDSGYKPDDDSAARA